MVLQLTTVTTTSILCILRLLELRWLYVFRCRCIALALRLTFRLAFRCSGWGFLKVHQSHDLLKAHLRVSSLQRMKHVLYLRHLLHPVIRTMRLVEASRGLRPAMHALVEAVPAHVVADLLTALSALVAATFDGYTPHPSQPRP